LDSIFSEYLKKEKVMRALNVLLFIFTLMPCTATPQNEKMLPAETEITRRVVAENLNHPWEILWGPDNHIWFTERGGKVSRMNPETGAVTLVATIPGVRAESESGLLGMALHPDFETSPYVYLAYTYNSSGDFTEKIVRFTYSNGTLTEPLTLLDGIKGNFIHDGCRLLIAPDKTLFITTGDAADQSLPQNMSSINGKVLRINLDGTIPSDNPFPGSPVWSFGHRNAQGLVISPKGIMYSSEHGPSTDDEINIISKGRNFGWPNVHGYCNTDAEKQFCAANNVVEPIAAWTPTIAVCGLDYYDHPAIPEWRNSLLLTTLRGSQFILLKLNESGTEVTEQQVLFGGYGRLRDLCVAPDGRVFVSTSNGGNDKIIEIKGETGTSVGPNEEVSGFDFKISPNPAAAHSALEFSLLKSAEVEVSIYNLLGEKVLSFKKFADTGKNVFPLDLSNLVHGFYTCRVQIASAAHTIPFHHVR
jgi:glucose/arabinose dehydrogenase